MGLPQVPKVNLQKSEQWVNPFGETTEWLVLTAKHDHPEAKAQKQHSQRSPRRDPRFTLGEGAERRAAYAMTKCESNEKSGRLIEVEGPK